MMLPPDSSSQKPAKERVVLVVDDAPLDRTLASTLFSKLGGWSVRTAEDGSQALALVKTSQPDLVLTDLQMPEMDGLALVRAIRSEFPRVPVILMTGLGSEEIAIQALKAGAASYVPKKSLAKDLEETVSQVMIAARTDRDRSRLQDYQSALELQYVFDNDPSVIPPLVGYVEDCLTRMQVCEPSGLVLLGVALHESLTNAMFHGNLELSSSLRETEESTYYRLAAERRLLSPWGQRRVYLNIRMSRVEATFVVRDEGPGFDPTGLPDPHLPENMVKVSGRGLLLIRTFMDHVGHNETGNQITMVKRRYR